MKKCLIILMFVLLCVFNFCSCENQDFSFSESPSSEETTEDSVNNEENKIYISDEILVKMEYELLNKNFSVYSSEYFGTEFSDCTIYDLYAGHSLYIVLKINESNIKYIDTLINRLNNRDDVMMATKLSFAEKSEFTEYVPGKTVLLLNRYYPFSKEFSGFNYPRKHRMIYYDVGNYADLVSNEEWLEFWNYYTEKNKQIAPNAEHLKEPDEMALVSFIKYFNIPKTHFEAKIEELKQARQDEGEKFYHYTEIGELANAEILYTFDNEIISNYYLYE